MLLKLWGIFRMKEIFLGTRNRIKVIDQVLYDLWTIVNSFTGLFPSIFAYQNNHVFFSIDVDMLAFVALKLKYIKQSEF